MNAIDFLVLNYPLVCVLLTFILGTIVGSFLNVCIARMPLEKSILWPGSRCGKCLQEVRWYDNLPLISYLRLGGRCRTCGATFSSRYFWIEFLTGLCFAGLFYLEVVANARSLFLPPGQGIPGMATNLTLMWLYHVVLVSCLLAATFIDFEHQVIPLDITRFGTIVGIIGGTLGPWPWPVSTEVVAQLVPNWEAGPASGMQPGSHVVLILPVAMQLWPVWLPVPEWMAPGTWPMGLLTSLAGAVFGTVLMRLIRAVFGWALNKESLGLGDADLMMMIGAFLGWQALIFVLGLGVLTGLLYVIGLVIINPKFLRGDRAFAFGPFLALGGVLTLLFFYHMVGLAWYLFQIPFQVSIFEASTLFLYGTLIVVVTLFTTLVIRMLKLIGAAA